MAYSAKVGKARQPRKTTGFTIIELLVVVVVIAILATITVVSYRGIQEKAKLVIVQTDLRNIAQQMEIFKVNNNRYPVQDVGGEYLEHEQVLRSSGIYSETRWSGDVGTRANRGYVFCLSDPANYTLVAFEPMYTFLRVDGAKYIGKPLYYIEQGKSLAQTQIEWDDALVTVARNICKSVTGVDPGSSTSAVRWTYNIPSLYAP